MEACQRGLFATRHVSTHSDPRPTCETATNTNTPTHSIQAAVFKAAMRRKGGAYTNFETCSLVLKATNTCEIAMGFDDGAAKGTGESVWQAWTRPATARRAAGAAPCALMLLATDFSARAASL